MKRASIDYSQRIEEALEDDMKTQQRLQLSAAVVIANGLFALGVTGSGPAFASACSSNNYFAGCGCFAQCNTVPGCTATRSCVSGLEPCAPFLADICTYS